MQQHASWVTCQSGLIQKPDIQCQQHKSFTGGSAFKYHSLAWHCHFPVQAPPCKASVIGLNEAVCTSRGRVAASGLFVMPSHMLSPTYLCCSTGCDLIKGQVLVQRVLYGCSHPTVPGPHQGCHTANSTSTGRAPSSVAAACNVEQLSVQHQYSDQRPTALLE
jgi:hypothetical protein